MVTKYVIQRWSTREPIAKEEYDRETEHFVFSGKFRTSKAEVFDTFEEAKQHIMQGISRQIRNTEGTLASLKDRKQKYNNLKAF